ncbi:hypothetical protein TEA_029131 [Camellia sinensis var. sinensis]|uniref:non-specific serine/threonine protein kinase n=1 Tax=Camellia sinensis var. sinensis TaxID=542762 RepID=A0A4S4ECE0_CAMSN|nr:hypothetical protein TEA_029131 [Camellia sinensis var. sinensis]
MDFSPTSRRARRVPAKPDIYSTVVVHGDEDEQQRKSTNPKAGDEEDLYATMVRKKDDQFDDDYDDDDDDDSSLPPLLKRLPKDFGVIDGDDDDSGTISATMIVKTDRSNRNRSPWKPRSANQVSPRRRRFEDEDDEEDDDERSDFSTFVMRSTVRDWDGGDSGTVVKRTSGSGSGGGGGGGSTLSMAVASMQAVGEGFGNQRKGSSGKSSWQNEGSRHGQQPSQVSSSSIPECVIKEDPTTKYELLNELGKGSYGSVYKARDIRTSELVAIKVISLCEGEEGYEEIRGEIEMLQQCSHPNVVRYLGSYQGEEYLWVGTTAFTFIAVMEYCGGGSVADLMNVTDEPLEESQIAFICREALKGLSYLHSIFKVHRDIKGGNILLTEQGEVKLGDFGVAAQLTRTMSKRNTLSSTVINRGDRGSVLCGLRFDFDPLACMWFGEKSNRNRPQCGLRHRHGDTTTTAVPDLLSLSSSHLVSLFLHFVSLFLMATATAAGLSLTTTKATAAGLSLSTTEATAAGLSLSPPPKPASHCRSHSNLFSLSVI